MRLVYGSYGFPVGQCEVLPSMRALRDESGRPYQYDWTILIRGTILNNLGVADSLAAQVISGFDYALRNALTFVGGSLVLYDDYGRPTSINFPSGPTAISPMQCVSFEYPNGGAGEYVTKREFTATFAVSYVAPARSGSYISYHEEIRVIGNGGGLIRWQPAINGPPVPVLINPETTIRVICSGSAVGYDSPPKIPQGPLPVGYLQNPQFSVSLSSPRYMGNRYAQYREYPASWNYIYEGRVKDLRPNLLQPRVWPLGK